MKRSLLALVFILLFTSLSFAGDYKAYGPYVGLSLGGQYVQDMDISGSSLDVSFDKGWGAAALVGYHWDAGFRLELEGAYLRNDLDKISSGANSARVDGSIEMKALMVNALWEFENHTPWFSYLGLGVGNGWSTAKAAGETATDSTPLAQPILGIGYRLSDHVSMAMDYKYLMSLRKLDYEGVKSNYRAHRVGLNLRYAF